MQEKPTILLLGTDHFEKTYVEDYRKTDDIDIFSNEKQNEIREVIECLKTYFPTKIVLEYPYKMQTKLSREYQQYVEENIELTANERQQLGFRLAKELGHKDIYAVDWNEPLDDVVDVFEYAQNNETEYTKQLFKRIEELFQEANKKGKVSTIREYLVYLNETEQVKNNHQLYVDLALIGEEDNPVGAKWVSNYWYYRNLLIYKNICELATETDRILVIIGSGHVYLLHQFIKEGDQFIVQSLNKYLEIFGTE